MIRPFCVLGQGLFSADAGAVHVVFRPGADPENAMRAFFDRHGLETPPDSGMPEHFSPHLPVECLYPVTPLPSGQPSISDMAVVLFRDVGGLGDEAEIRFRYHEVANFPYHGPGG